MPGSSVHTRTQRGAQSAAKQPARILRTVRTHTIAHETARPALRRPQRLGRTRSLRDRLYRPSSPPSPNHRQPSRTSGMRYDLYHCKARATAARKPRLQHVLAHNERIQRRLHEPAPAESGPSAAVVACCTLPKTDGRPARRPRCQAYRPPSSPLTPCRSAATPLPATKSVRPSTWLRRPPSYAACQATRPKRCSCTQGNATARSGGGPPAAARRGTVLVRVYIRVSAPFHASISSRERHEAHRAERDVAKTQRQRMDPAHARTKRTGTPMRPPPVHIPSTAATGPPSRGRTRHTPATVPASQAHVSIAAHTQPPDQPPTDAGGMYSLIHSPCRPPGAHPRPAARGRCLLMLSQSAHNAHVQAAAAHGNLPASAQARAR